MNYNKMKKKFEFQKEYQQFFVVFMAIMVLNIPMSFARSQEGDPKEKLTLVSLSHGQTSFILLSNATSIKSAEPLEKIAVFGVKGKTIIVKDGKGREYVNMPVSSFNTFVVGGALGKHTVIIADKKGNEISKVTFEVDATTKITDKGKYQETFDLFNKSMRRHNSSGVSSVEWKGQKYNFFVPWVLDNYYTSLGMQYFSPYASELVDILKKAQREDGMIFSFVKKDPKLGYFDTSRKKYGFFKRDGEIIFVRQPTENHVEYLYVSLMYLSWKAKGDLNWLKENVNSAAKALDYSMTDTIRWSKRFKLLKRPYTIDSWDFQADDQYTPKTDISPTMLIDEHTKYGVFYGDNTGYAKACEELGEMFEMAGQKQEADKYRSRAKEIRSRLNDISWNGRFFTHFIEEDEKVKRDFGVDEKSQISQSNMYSVNRNISKEQNIAIIKTYLDLKENLPVGSPGEWYAIYPPFEKGFGSHNEKWQYMNGGIAGHGAGELARGAFENGYEKYGTSIIERLTALGKKHDNKIYFSYTGSIPPPPATPNYKCLDLSTYANMDICDKGGKNTFTWMNTEVGSGNDMRNLPTGEQTFNNIKFKVVDPAKNNRRSAVAVSSRSGFPQKVEVPVNDIASSIYLLHAISSYGPENVCGAITFEYTDGKKNTRYILNQKHVSEFWFPELNSKEAGVAWDGPNPKSERVGVYWATIPNPSPEKTIKKIIINSTLDEAIYSVLGVTLSDKPHYVAPDPVSYGGPDNWAAATAMASLMEGLAGLNNEGVAYSEVRLSPRWTSAETDSINVVSRFAASDGYVAYNFIHKKEKKEITLRVTGSGEKINGHILLPNDVSKVQSVTIGNQSIPFKVSQVEKSNYADFSINLPATPLIVVKYE